MSIARPFYCLAHYADVAGCGTHRIIRPIELMAKAGLIGARCDMNIWNDDNLIALNPDIVIWQRQHDDVQIEAIARYRKLLPNAFIVYELDDILSAVPDWSIHHAFIPFDVDERMARAIKQCDAVSVSTKTLGEHIKKVCGESTDVRVVPNMIGRDEWTAIAEIRKTRRHPVGKYRIGWAGGISHKADLDLIIPSMQELGDRVTWVFLGMKPECDYPVEFHPGVPPREFLPKLASLDLDLVIAPLVDCTFNQCKSNLRLLEAGTCGYPVIASRVTPYVEGSPPVYSYAEPDEWTKKITRFLDASNKSGKALHDWVEKKYIFDDKMEENLRAWLPYGAKIFKPKQRVVAAEQITIVCKTPGFVPDKYRVVKTFAEVGSINSDVLYLRPGSSINEDQIKRLRARLIGSKFASSCPLSNDGGMCSFPKMGGFAQIDNITASQIDEICKEKFSGLTVEVPFPTGPAIMLSRKALDVVGMPADNEEEDEASLIEWGITAMTRGFANIVSPDLYMIALTQTVFERFHQTLRRISLRWPPFQSHPDPLREARAHLEMEFYKRHYSLPILTSPNNYAEWTSLGDELGTRDKKVLGNLDFPDILVATYPNKPSLLREARRDNKKWIILSAHDSVLSDHALFIFNEAIKNNPKSVLLYADHDFLDDKSQRIAHDFKPSTVDYHQLLGRDYITPVFAINVGAVSDLLGDNLVSFTEIDVYELCLSFVYNYPSDMIVHVPWVLAHLAIPDNVSGTDKIIKKIGAANKHLQKTEQNITVTQHPIYPQYGELSYNTGGQHPLVSIIILTGGKVEMLSPCVETLQRFTSYPNYEILIVTDKTVPESCRAYLDTLRNNPKVRILCWPQPYNWSAKNNWAINHASGSYYLLLNDDTRFAEPVWLTEMVGAALCKDVGAVGARLLYPQGLIQHIGVICHNGLTGHLCKLMPEHSAGYNGIAAISHETTAVTGACLLISKKLYEEVGKLDERFAHNFNDVALCVELNRRGYKNILPARAVLQHLEGVTRTSPISDKGATIQRDEGALLGKLYKDKDLYWNDNLFFAHVGGGFFVSGLNYDILSWPKKPWPWRDETWQYDKVLFIGDNDNAYLNEVRDGHSVYVAKLYGFNIRIERPTLENIPPFDIRDLPRASAMIAGLGINRIVLNSIMNGTVELLPFLLKLGIPVDYCPVDGESVCPRRNFHSNGVECDGGYRRGLCGSCLLEHNSPFGEVNIPGWRDTWVRFLNSTTLDKSFLPQIAKDAMGEVFRK